MSMDSTNTSHKRIPAMGMTGEEFLEAVRSSSVEIERYLGDVLARNVLPDVEPGYLRQRLPQSAPTHGESWQAIQSDMERAIMPGMTHWQHPKFMAFFPATTSYPSMLGELFSSALAAPAFNWICSPAVTELETIVLDWFAQMLDLPPDFLSKGEGGGTIQLSASDAIVTVMVVARERYIRRKLELEGFGGTDGEREDRCCELRGKLVALGSEQSHISTKKASVVAGTRFRTVRAPHADSYAMTGQALRHKLEELSAKGLHVYYLTVTLGTTNTCAVDEFQEIAAVVKDYPDLWVHCDAAWAGAALILPEYQHLSKQMSFANSFNVNMHKWLLTNFDASLLYVQRRKDLTDVLSLTPAYLRNSFSDSGLVIDYRDWRIPLGSRFRSLKIWFVIRAYGVEGLQAHVRKGIDLGDTFAQLIRSREDLFRLIAPPRFALTVFTVKPHAGSRPVLDVRLDGTPDAKPDPDRQTASADEHLQKANAVTKAVFELVQRRGDFFLTSSVIADVYAIRVVSGNALADETFVREVFALLVSSTEEVLAKGA